MPVRSVSPGEKTQFCSATGLDIEAQIADGGGVAAMRASEGNTASPGTGAPRELAVPQTSRSSRREGRRDEEEIPMARLVSGSGWVVGGR
jgi:hypothetical protein